MEYQVFGPISHHDFCSHVLYQTELNIERMDKHEFKYFMPSQYDGLYFYAVDANQTVLGFGVMEQSPYFAQEDLLWLQYINVHESAYRNGVANRILHQMFAYAETEHKSILNSSYSDYSKDFLPAKINLIAAQYPSVILYEQSETREYDSNYTLTYVARAKKRREMESNMI